MSSVPTSAANSGLQISDSTPRTSVARHDRLLETTPPERNARLAAFCSPRAPAVFESIVYQPQIWTPDPFDIPEIHKEAREVFMRLLDRASATPAPKSGKLLLLKGQAGSGKTHLMRAFRKLTHEKRQGYFAYLQMRVNYSNYGRYLLGRLIDSLSQPYLPPEVTASGLNRLSTWVFDAIPGVTDQERQDFREGAGDDVERLVFEYADRALSDSRLGDCDIDLMRALLFLQSGMPRLMEKAIRWMRCQNLSAYDRDALGGLVPRAGEEDPILMVAQLGKLMALVEGAALVICVDQLDDVVRGDAPAKQFAEAIDALVSLADEVPTCVLVVACIEDYYIKGQQQITQSKLDRLERDPSPIRLGSARTLDEVQWLLARRLDFLYEEVGLASAPAFPTFPFQIEDLRPLANLNARHVLDNLRLHQQRCIAAGEWVNPDRNPFHEDQGQVQDFGFEEDWNNFQTQHAATIPEDEAGRALLLASAIQQCNRELPDGYRFTVASNGRTIDMARRTPTSENERFFVALCEKGAQGGGLGKQVNEAVRQANGVPLIIVRSSPFPKSAKSEVVRQLGQLIAEGGRRVEVVESDWRFMQTFAVFAPRYENHPRFTDWVRESRPMSQLSSLRALLDLDRLPPPRAWPSARAKDDSKGAGSVDFIRPAVPPETPTSTSAAPPSLETAPPNPSLRLGVSGGVSAAPVCLNLAEIKQHMAFLGGSGSGKTTAALLLIEQLLDRGVPAVLVDRKGDLCLYADPDGWTSQDPVLSQRLKRLRDSVEVALYTPGAPAGRALSIPVVPDGLAQMPVAEREQLAEYAAAALATMMGYNPGRRSADKVHQVILAKAIILLAETSSGPRLTLDAVHALVETQDPALLNAVNGYDPRHFRKLAENLLTLKLSSARLLGEAAEPLNIEAMFGRGSSGKTRLTIISTQGLGDCAAVDFWLSQFLVALDRWRAASPSEELQGVLLLDEADQYLPATSQPATKAPLESLLRRARSAGLGILLATQSPGDLDYRCRDQIRNWLVGRVRETVALNKLKPMFAEARLDVAAKLPNQATGEFVLLQEGQATLLKTDRSLMRTRQLTEARIIELAAISRRSSKPSRS